jgi:SAM-dependent methyltransferase
MKTTYTQVELDDILRHIELRLGWDFSRMNTVREPVPWDYVEEVKKYLGSDDDVLDIGTGGGERFVAFAPYFRSGVGIDIDEEMVRTARQNANRVANMTFMVLDEKLAGLNRRFNIIINRHAPFDLGAVKSHLLPSGYFITQQVGEKNMRNIREVLGKPIGRPVITKAMVEAKGLRCVDFREYDVEYVVEDIESLVFWLNALDMLHADLAGNEALKSADILNRILANNVDERGFITNEHRYLAVAQL